MGKWKGIRLNVMKEPDSSIQLFNLDTDPGETKDVAAENAAVVKRIKKIMQKEHTENINFPFLKN